jgi:hypothetical protein
MVFEDVPDPNHSTPYVDVLKENPLPTYLGKTTLS